MTAATAYLITASASAVLAWVAWRWTYETTAWNRNARRNIARATAAEAEVERLRAVVERVEALADEWEEEADRAIRGRYANSFTARARGDAKAIRAALDPAVPATEGHDSDCGFWFVGAETDCTCKDATEGESR